MLMLVAGLLAGHWLTRRPHGAAMAAAAAAHEATVAAHQAALAEAAALRDADVMHRLKHSEIAGARDHAQARLAELAGVEAAKSELAIKLAAVEAERTERDRAHAAEVARTAATFAALAGQALDAAHLKLAEANEAALVRHREAAGAGLETNRAALAELIAPMRDTLAKYEVKLDEVEKARTESYGGLKEQLLAVTTGQQRVSDEASKLVSALRSSGKTSGSWGEQQLKNVLEMAGLRDGIDFDVQASTSGDGGAKRPDAIIKLPGGRQLIVDSKCSLNDYLSAAEADSEDARRVAHKRHAAAVRVHAKGLSEKAYWKDFGHAADFVVMFLPGENFLSAALEHDLGLWSWASDQRILLAGPTNLLAIAKIVALTWNQERQSQEWREIGKLGAELHASVAVMTEHVLGLGKNLGQAVNGYNAFVRSLESNVLPKARRFTELGVEEGKRAIAPVGLIEASPAAVSARELLAAPIAEAAE